jgi:arabinose-5-phosphate isomerase
MNGTGANVIRIEADALRRLADRVAGPMAQAFSAAIELLSCCASRVVVTGMGKSGLVARKIAATLSSTGTPALFLHPAEALHGDLGMITRGDVVIALSSSGDTEEILSLLPTIKRLEVKLISVTGDPIFSPNSSGNGKKLSALAQSADVALDCSIDKEACSLGLAPTASTTSMLALGDALAVALADKKGFREEDFADLHPGGKLGKKLAKVSSLMHSGDAIPLVAPNTSMTEVIYEMSRKKLGITTVVDGERLAGVISDGDLRRLLERRGKEVMDLTAGECMSTAPKTIGPDEFATAALNIMEQKKITSLVVIDSKRRVQGIIHLHDLWGTELV